MAGRFELLNFFRPFVRFLPEVQSPENRSVIPFRQKAVYTAISLFIFLAGSQLPLYGIDYYTFTAAADPLYWTHTAIAANCNTVMALGIIPVLGSETVIHILLGWKIIKVDNGVPEERMLLNGVQRLLGILLAIGFPIATVLSAGTASQFGMGNAILIVLQLAFGGVIVVYLDEVLRKGYGLLSSISLFTATNICASVFSMAFSPYGVHAAGDTRNVTSTVAFFLIALNLQGFHVALPLRPRDRPGLQVNYTIRLSYLSYAPIIFQGALVSTTYFISQLLYMKFGENKLVNLLGKWKGSKYFGQPVPVSGIAYYLTTPPTLADVERDPVHALLYAVLLLMGCALLSTALFKGCVHSEIYVARLLGDEATVTLAQPGSIPRNQWKRYVAMVAFCVGFCVGALTLLAGFIGVRGSGTGIMLAVTVLYSCFEGRSNELGVFGL